MTVAADTPPAPDGTRARFAELLRRLRGEVPLNELARRLGVTRQTTMELERGWTRDPAAGWTISNPSLERLERIAHAYGVRFEVIAVDVRTGRPVTGQAPGLARPEVPPVPAVPARALPRRLR